MASTLEISALLQGELRRRGVSEASAVEAASWLDAAALLKDSASRPGAPLRLLRDDKVVGAVQRPQTPKGRWFIRRRPNSGAPSTSVRTSSAPRPRRQIDPKHGFALTENDVVDAVCGELEKLGFSIDSRATTLEQGADIVASRRSDGLVLAVEAKGGTSSKPGTKRFGAKFSTSQVHTHISKALFAAAAATRDSRSRSAVAFPDTELHRRYVARIQGALRELGIGVFWVTGDRQVALEAEWEPYIGSP